MGIVQGVQCEMVQAGLHISAMGSNETCQRMAVKALFHSIGKTRYKRHIYYPVFRSAYLENRHILLKESRLCSSK